MKLILAFIVTLILPCQAGESSNSSKISIRGITLEDSTFDDVFKVFGKSKIHHKGETSTYLAYTCFILKEGDFVQFGSSVIGSGKYITEVFLERSSSSISNISRKNCVKVNVSVSEVTFNNGLGLGINQQKVLSVLGKSKSKNKKHINYQNERKVKGGYELRTYRVTLDDKHLVSGLEVSQVTTN